jgi:signal transduction histidine kinase
VKLNSHSINLLIRDNGKGFDSTKVHTETSGGNGLYNMKQRADKWKGGLTIESLPGKGTVVRVSMRI